MLKQILANFMANGKIIKLKTWHLKYPIFRLLFPYTCPYGGKRNDSCACSNDGHVSSGLSRFRRVRVDLHNMKINRKLFVRRMV